MSRKLCCLTLLAFTLTGYSILRTSHLSNPSTPILKADGTDPVPPWPKLRISDLSSQSTPILKADGGDPVPPWPKPLQLAA